MAEKRLTHTITVDLAKETWSSRPVLVQNSDNTFLITVLNDGEPADLSDVRDIVLAVIPSRKKANDSVYSPGVKVGSTSQVKIDLGRAAVATPGIVQAQLKLTGTNGGLISSTSFNFEVQMDAGLNFQPSENELTLIETVLGDGPTVLANATQTIADMESTQATLTGAVGGAISSLNEDKATAIEELAEVREANRFRQLDAVTTVAERDSTYPNPEHGDTVRVTSDATMYKYDKDAGWVVSDRYEATAVDALNQQLAETDAVAVTADQKATSATDLANQANAKADNPLAALTNAGYKVSLDDLSNDVKNAMTGTTGITTAKGLLENNRGVEFPLKNVPRDGVLHPFEQEVKDVVLDAKVFNPNPSKYYSIAEIRNGSNNSWGITINEYDKGTFATDSESSRRQIVHAASNGHRSQPANSIETIDVTAESVRFLVTVDYSKINLNALFLDVGSSPKAKGNVIHESNYVFNLTERLELPEKNRGIEYPLKNVKRDGAAHSFSQTVKNAVLDAKVIGAEMGKVYSLSYISKGAFDSYGFTIYEYDESTFGSNSAGSQNRILHISTEPFSQPETSVVTRVVKADNGVIFVLTVDYSKITGTNLNIANSLSSGQAYGAIIDKTNYVYDYKKGGSGGSETTAELKLLMVGNSYALNAVDMLTEIAKSAGVRCTVGVIYDAGQSLQGHWDKMQSGATVSYYDEWSTETEYQRESSVTHAYCFNKHDWDIVTYQQSSANSHDYTTFQPYLNSIRDHVAGILPNAKHGMHMIWARANPTTHGSSLEMFNGIAEAYQAAMQEMDFDILLPTGTAIENARTNAYLEGVNDRLTRDNSHLDEGIGYYIAALSVFGALFDKDVVKDVSFYPTTNGATKFLSFLSRISSNHAVLNPFSVTEIS